MKDFKGGFFNHQEFRNSLKSKRRLPLIWNKADMTQLQSEMQATDIDIIAFSSESQLRGCEILPGNLISLQWINPGVKLNHHTHSWWHIFIIQSGEGHMIMEDDHAVQIREGDVIVVPAWSAHGFCNGSVDTPLVMLNIVNSPQLAALSSLD